MSPLFRDGQSKVDDDFPAIKVGFSLCCFEEISSAGGGVVCVSQTYEEYVLTLSAKHGNENKN